MCPFSLFLYTSLSLTIYRKDVDSHLLFTKGYNKGSEKIQNLCGGYRGRTDDL